jgi:SAM-dependent methyltransferase
MSENLTAAPQSAATYNRYGRMCAEVYDLDKPTGSLGDIDFYRERLATVGGPILEAGCGTGRLLIPLLEAGLDVEGFDASEPMLEICKERCDERGLSPRLSRMRFQDFAYERPFAAIVVPVSTFILVDDYVEATAVLERFWRHLEPGGVLILDMPTLEFLEKGMQGVRCWTTPEGDLLRLDQQRFELDWLRQRAVSHDRYERWRDGRLVETELEVMAYRAWGERELSLALRAAGFADVQVYAGGRPGVAPRRIYRQLTFETRKA